MSLPTSLPPSVPAVIAAADRIAIRDLCALVEVNASLRSAVSWPRVAALAERLDGNADVALTPDEIQLAVDLAEMVVKALMAGTRLIASEVLIRICERVVTPITDALGYRGP
ncbi:MAG: hypothetical protein ACK4JB_17395 [Reyranella sp.]